MRASHTQRVLAAIARDPQIALVNVEIYSGNDLEALRRAGRVAAETLQTVASRVRPGISTLLIDEWVRQDTAARGARPSQLGYHGFPASVCVSKNDVVCHGIPSPDIVLCDGDIVNIDVTSELDGFHGDTSTMVLVGNPSEEARQLVAVADRCRQAGISEVRPGARLGDVAHAIMEVARNAGCSVVEQFGGHGIGRRMHQDPHVSYIGRPGRGFRLREGMALTIEPMINAGGPDVVTSSDGWTVQTADGALSAQFEHTVLVVQGGAEVLTTCPSEVAHP